ncbi:hypothetical protein Tco_0279495, partial [Tanacetum coccineum]
MQMVGGNYGNQFRQYAGQNVRNQNGYNVIQNVRNHVVQNPDSVVDRSKGRGRNPTQTEEFDFIAAAGDLEEIGEVNANCILMAN